MLDDILLVSLVVSWVIHVWYMFYYQKAPFTLVLLTVATCVYCIMGPQETSGLLVGYVIGFIVGWITIQLKKTWLFRRIQIGIASFVLGSMGELDNTVDRLYDNFLSKPEIHTKAAIRFELLRALVKGLRKR